MSHNDFSFIPENLSLSDKNEGPWFYYWRTSQALWDEEIRAIPQHFPLLIPFNWSLHQVVKNGKISAFVDPENILFNLLETCRKMGRKCILLIPIGPNPFLPNGGIPAALANYHALNEHGLMKVTVAEDGAINRMYSFFDTYIFKSFQHLIKTLALYFKEKNLSPIVWGMRIGHVQDLEFHSFFSDKSDCFFSGLNQYLSLKELPTLNREDAINEYSHFVESLYISSLKKNLNLDYQGEIQLNLLGSTPQHLFLRSFEQEEHKIHYLGPLLDSFNLKSLPLLSLLNKDIRKDLLFWATELIFNQNFFDEFFNLIPYTQEENGFKLFKFFYLLINPDLEIQTKDLFKQSSFLTFVRHHYPNLYYVNNQLMNEKTIEMEELPDEAVYIVHSLGLMNHQLNALIKLFLNGKKIILDTDAMDASLKKRLELLFYENGIKIQRVDQEISCEFAFIGEGQFILYSAEELRKISEKQRFFFWSKILKALDFSHPSLEMEEGVHSFSMISKNTGHNFNISSTKRIILINPTSYKKKAQIFFDENQQLLKIQQIKNVEQKQHAKKLEMTLFPGGLISVDIQQSGI